MLEDRVKKLINDVSTLQRGAGLTSGERSELDTIWTVASWLLDPDDVEDPLELYREELG